MFKRANELKENEIIKTTCGEECKVLSVQRDDTNTLIKIHMKSKGDISFCVKNQSSITIVN